MSHPYFDVPEPTILGHRGAAGSAPENTLESFAKGLEYGAHIIESDIHVTRDGVPVLIHDPSVDRTTDGHGDVGDLAWDEVRRLDAGYHFDPSGTGRFPARDQGVRIPSLEETFERFPGIRFNFEIKAPGEALAARILELIGQYERADLTLVTAGNDDDMASLRKALAASTVTPAIGASLGDILDVVRSALSGAKPGNDSMAIQIPAAFGDSPLVTPELVKHCHTHGLRVHVWTINEPDEMRRLLDLGVDGLVTDHPERMAALLGSEP